MFQSAIINLFRSSSSSRSCYSSPKTLKCSISLLSSRNLQQFTCKRFFINSSHQHAGGGGGGAQLPSRGSVLARSALFTASFGAVCFGGAAIVTYEMKKMNINRSQSVFSSYNSREKFSELRIKFNEFWNRLSPVKKLAIGIMFANVLVFIAWRVPAYQLTMMRYFQLDGLSHNNLQLLLSTFSHVKFFHVALNMICLYTISDMMASFLSPAQFMAFYLSSGVFASFCSRAFKIATLTSVPSLGASGALLACFALSSILYPHSKFYIFPVPFPIEAHMILKFIVAFDLFMLITRRKIGLDNAAHLGGVLYGYLFYTLAPNYVNDYQKFVHKKWKEIRS